MKEKKDLKLDVVAISTSNNSNDVQLEEASNIEHHVNFPPTGPIKTNQNYIKTSKYTIFTFLPLNLYSQYKRIYNIYFLAAAISSFSIYSAFSPLTQAVPVISILAVSAIKDGIEDHARYKQDKLANSRIVKVLRKNLHSSSSNSIELINILAKDIIEGDIIYYEKNERFSVDAILISSSNEDGSCFVDTAELDGETNLKRRNGPTEFLNYKTVEQICLLNGEIQSEKANQNLLSFDGRLVIPSSIELNDKDAHHTIPLSINSLLLRGAVLRNTEHCWGLVLYTGGNTKIMKNLKKAKSKYSTFERKLNLFTLLAFLYNIVLLVSSIYLELGNYNVKPSFYYLLPEFVEYSTQALMNFLSYFGLYSYVIPISLFVSLEVTRIVQGLFMHWDEKMTYTLKLPNNLVQIQRFRANNTSLNENLGTVEYIFSDKTGTLTQNNMVLSKYFINGHIFDELNTPGCLLNVLKSKKFVIDDSTVADLDPLSKEYIVLFSRVLALAHDVIPSNSATSHGIIYESSSPDETALVNSAAQNAFVLLTRSKNSTIIDTPGYFGDIEEDGTGASQSPVISTGSEGLLGGGVGNFNFSDSSRMRESFEPLKLLEFNSDRKRMSVIVRLPNGKIHLYCKGADNIMIPRLSKDKSLNPDDLICGCEKALLEFSEAGLRTLVVAWRELGVEEYENFIRLYEVAERTIGGREEKLGVAAEMVEVDLRFLGCTAIEDKLQDDVPNTIDYILKADIKLWLLTGDKQETAVNIGYSSKLLNSSMTVHKLSATSSNEIHQKLKSLVLQITSSIDKTHALVINGDALSLIFDGNPETQIAFLDVGTKCKSVICCRVSPLQKAQVVNLVKTNLKCTTLAIGDGANDVSMIQSSDIGCGIMGKEGTQAVRAADYAFAEFKYLRRLLAVHGRYSYLRISAIILFSFFKNISMITVQFYFGFFSLWSGSIVYEEIFMAAFNVIYTSLPPLVMAIFDKDVNDDFIEKYPQLYIQVKRDVALRYWKWTGWGLEALYQSFVTFWSVYMVCIEGVLSDTGRSTGYWVQTSIVGTSMLLSVLTRFMIHTKSFTILTFLAIGLSIILHIASLWTLEIFGFSEIGTGVIEHMSYNYYFVVIFIIVTANLPIFVVISWKRLFHPEDADIICEEQKIQSTSRVFSGSE